MALNATVIVQAIHFLCAYVLLDRLLFAPVIRVILDQEDEEFKKTKRNQKEDRCKEDLLVKKQKQWLVFKDECKQVAPAMVCRSFVSTKIKKIYTSVDDKLIRKLRKECADAFFEKCSVVRK
jgi:hypothetical protein